MRSLAAVAIIGLAACYSPSRTSSSCTVQCGNGGECPEGYRCGSDNYCYASSADEGSCTIDPVDSGPMPDAELPFTPIECMKPEDCDTLDPEGRTCRCGFCAFVDFECPVSNLRYTDAELPLGRCVAGVTDIDLGYQHTCARRTDGSVYCWGLNCSGQLGNGEVPDCSAANVSLPVPTAVLDGNGDPVGDAKRVAAMFLTTCIVKDDDTVWCWGDGIAGALGDGVADEMRALAEGVQVVDADDMPLMDVESLITGGAFACALRSDGSLWCWGDNKYSQLGTDEVGDSFPHAVKGQDGSWAFASAGSDHVCAAGAAPSEQIVCWGRNNLGQLGHTVGVDETTQANPVTVIKELDGTDLLKPAALGLGAHMSCAGTIQPDQMWCWGQNASHALGDGINPENPDGPTAWSARPVVLELMTTVADIDAGQKFACGLLQNGDLYCWGGNDFGQTGAASNEPFLIDPTKIRSDVRLFSAGYEHACAVTTDNSIYCWGNNVEGQLGDGTYQQRNEPALAEICP